MEQNQINLSALNEMLEDLAQKNWAVSQQVFPREFCQTLAHECQKLAESGQMNKASIGRGTSKSVQSEIRGDFIHWLEAHPVLEPLETLRQKLNEFFFLGLKRIEVHFAFYPPGAGYDKHIDNHRGLNHRKVTLVLYLNEFWKKGDGGELSIYSAEDENQKLAQVEPTLGTLVLFRSELFPHQVEKSTAPRLSLTGWFRDDAL